MINVVKSEKLIDDYCNVCGSRSEEGIEKFRLEFKHKHNGTTVFRLCEKHMIELQDKIGETLK